MDGVCTVSTVPMLCQAKGLSPPQENSEFSNSNLSKNFQGDMMVDFHRQLDCIESKLYQWDALLGMSVGVFSGRIRWDGKTHPDRGWLMSWGPAKAAEHNVPYLCFLFTQKWTICPVTLSCHRGILPQYMGPRNHGLTPLKQRAKKNPFSFTFCSYPLIKPTNAVLCLGVEKVTLWVTGAPTMQPILPHFLIPKQPSESLEISACCQNIPQSHQLFLFVPLPICSD